MSPSTRFYFRSLPPVGIGYFFISLLLDLIISQEMDVIGALVNSLFFSLIFVGIMHFIHYGYVKAKLKRAPTFEELKPLQEEHIKLQRSLEQLQEELSKKPLKDSTDLKRLGDTIQLRVVPVGNLIGEYLEIAKVNEGEDDFLIRSRPRWRLGEYFADNGKGIENIAALKAHLDKLGVIYS